MPDARTPSGQVPTCPTYLSPPGSLPSLGSTVRPTRTPDSPLGGVLGGVRSGTSLVDILASTTSRDPIFAPPVPSVLGVSSLAGTLSSHVVARAQSCPLSVAAPGTPLLVILENHNYDTVPCVDAPSPPPPAPPAKPKKPQRVIYTTVTIVVLIPPDTKDLAEKLRALTPSYSAGERVGSGVVLGTATYNFWNQPLRPDADGHLGMTHIFLKIDHGDTLEMKHVFVIFVMVPAKKGRWFELLQAWFKQSFLQHPADFVGFIGHEVDSDRIPWAGISPYAVTLLDYSCNLHPEPNQSEDYAFHPEAGEAVPGTGEGDPGNVNPGTAKPLDESTSLGNDIMRDIIRSYVAGGEEAAVKAASDRLAGYKRLHQANYKGPGKLSGGLQKPRKN